MGNLAAITRRSFLIGSVAITGGMLIGCQSKGFSLLQRKSKDKTHLTPYIRIDQTGITIITPRADMGQGAYSVQAALVAEELDVELDDDSIQVDHGPPKPEYFNGKVLSELLPFASTDNSKWAVRLRNFTEGFSERIGLFMTGGSSTVADAHYKLRLTGAVARQLLIMAAAERSKVHKNKLKTENGHVLLPDGTKYSYVELAPEAADIKLSEEIKIDDLKLKSNCRVLGKPMQRVDMVDKCTGKQKYGIDINKDGMLYAAVRTNPRLGGKIISYDAKFAESIVGKDKVIPISGGVGVIADNTWQAFELVDSIDIKWEDASYPETSYQMWEEFENSFTPWRKKNRLKNEGNVKTALEQGDVVEANYRVPYLAHAPLEPMNATVLLEDGRLDIWVGTQIPLFVKSVAAKLTGLSEDNIHVYVEVMGGSFGRRLEDDFVCQAIELAKARPGDLIKMTWSREEDMTHDFPRTMQLAKARGVVNNGKVEAMDLKIAALSTTASQFSRTTISLPGLRMPISIPEAIIANALRKDVALVSGAWDQPFSIPNYRVTGYKVPSMVPVSSWRSVGASGNGFFHDCFLDELIHAAGADPLEERIRLCSHSVSSKVLEKVGEMSNWGSALPAGSGRGVAYTLSFGVPVAEVVEVTNTAKGIKIDKAYVVADVGKVLDPVNIENQMMGGVIWGLGHAMNAELTYKDGKAEQTNFHAYECMRMYQTPEIEICALENADEIRGIGEPTVPPAAPALANAIFAATGQRIRELPLNKHIKFI